MRQNRPAISGQNSLALTSRLPPDIFEEQLVPGKSMSSILNDFRKLSPDRKNTILSLMKDMEAGMMLSQYVKKEQA